MNSIIDDYFIKLKKKFVFSFEGIDYTNAWINEVRPKIINDKKIRYIIENNSKTKTYFIFYNYQYVFLKYSKINNVKLLNFCFITELFYFFFKIFILIYIFFKKKKKTKNNKLFFYTSGKKKYLDYLYKIIPQPERNNFFKIGNFKSTKDYFLNRNTSIFDDFITFNLKMDILTITKGIKSLKPKCIVCIEGNKSTDYIISTICRKLNVKSVCLQWGINADLNPNVSLRDFNFDYYLSWGIFFSKRLKKFNKNCKFLNIGNLKEIPHHNSKKNKILFLLHPYNNFFLKKKFINIFNQLIDWCVLNYGTERIIIRTHPDMNFNDIKKTYKKKNLEIHDGSKINFTKSIRKTNLAVSIYSSSLFESSFFIKNVIFFLQTTNYLNFNSYLANKNNVFIISEIDDVKKKIKRLFNSNSSSHYFDNKFIRCFGKDSQKKAINFFNKFRN